MRTYAALASSVILVLSTAAPRAADGDERIQEASSNKKPVLAIVESQGATSGGTDATRLSGLTDAELKAKLTALQAELARRKKKTAAHIEASNNDPSSPSKQSAKSGKSKDSSPSAYYQQIYLRELGYPHEAAANPVKTPPSDPCNPQRLFLRANQLDNYLYGITPASKAKGASISYTDNLAAGTQDAVINGMLSYVVLRDICPVTPPGDGAFISGYSIAPFVFGQGNYTQPKLKTEQSALQFGVNNQFEISRFLIPRQAFTITPYYQTDYRGLASAIGVKAYWQPYDADLHLGGYIDTNPYLGWFWQLQGEVDERNVSSVGVTNLKKTNYDWIGGTAALNLFFLPADPNVPDWIRNRFAFYATANYFTDANSGKSISYYSAKLSYKISVDGSSAISVEYDNGTQETTLVAARQYLVSLSYAY
jgi:hypothetical protein